MQNNYDVIIVGAGPAGITAAIYLKRAGINPLIIEKDAPGGTLNKTTKIEIRLRKFIPCLRVISLFILLASASPPVH